MHANIGSPSDRAAPAEKPRERLISIPYLLLRFSTAGGAFAMGFVQTFVFARILSPERFSIFIVVGAIGYTLWLTDLGLAKILFVNLRAPHLAGTADDRVARQATAVILFYLALAVAASLVCFVAAWAQPAATLRGAVELALFLLYVTLNLAWFSLRSISIAVDLFVFYERLELVRRVVNISTMLAMLIGLPLTIFLVGSNVLWAVLFVAASAKLVQRGGLAPRLNGAVHELMTFFKSNRPSILRSGTSALSGVFIATFPYYVVPIAFGLGSAPIILEVTFRIFRGACVIFAAICDLAIPGQTRAIAARDADRLVRTTLLVAALCCVPATIGCALLIFAGKPLFAFLLRSAATVPPAIVPILVVLLIANILQMVSESLLQYSGSFRSLARNGAIVSAMMIVATAVAAALKFDLVEFLAAYAAVYAVGSVLLTVAAVRGPIRAAAHGGGIHPLSGVFTALRSALRAPRAIPVPQGTARRTPQPSQNP
jgi:O-antigen/teichoic acid export membrane protein